MSIKEDIRVVLVTRKTRLQELTERFNTWPQAKFYLEHSGVSVSDYLAEHDSYQAQLTQAKQILQPFVSVHCCRAINFLPVILLW